MQIIQKKQRKKSTALGQKYQSKVISTNSAKYDLPNTFQKHKKNSPYFYNAYFGEERKPPSIQKLKKRKANSIKESKNLPIQKKFSDTLLGRNPIVSMINSKNSNPDIKEAQLKPFKHRSKNSLKKLINPHKYKRNSEKLLTSYPNTVTLNEIWGSQQYLKNYSSFDPSLQNIQFQQLHNQKKIKSESTKQSYKELECKQAYFNNNADTGCIYQQQQYILKLMIYEQRNIDTLFRISSYSVDNRMRYQTLDWIFSLAEEINLHRQTIYLGILYFDSYIRNCLIRNSELQLVAIASIVLAYKLQQNAPEDFIDIFESPNGYPKHSIIQMEQKIAFALKFKLRMPTHYFWLNALTESWDKFIQQSRILSLSIIQQNISLITKCLKFRNVCNKQIFYNLTQLLDTSIYDIEIYNHEKHKILLSAIYLIMRIQIQHMIQKNSEKKYKFYHEKYRKNSNALFLDKYGFNQLFSEFLYIFEMELCDLLPTNRFLAQFIEIEFLTLKQQVYKASLEEIIISQSYNQATLFYFNAKH